MPGDIATSVPECWYGYWLVALVRQRRRGARPRWSRSRAAPPPRPPAAACPCRGRGRRSVARRRCARANPNAVQQTSRARVAAPVEGAARAADPGRTARTWRRAPRRHRAPRGRRAPPTSPEHLHPRQPGPVVVVAVDGERGCGPGAEPAHAGGLAGTLGLVVDDASTSEPPSSAKVTGSTRGAPPSSVIPRRPTRDSSSSSVAHPGTFSKVVRPIHPQRKEKQWRSPSAFPTWCPAWTASR